MLDDDRQVWERQRSEGPRQFRYFERYLELGEGRTRRQLTDLLYGHRRRTSRYALSRQIGRWSRRWLWDERAAAWDWMVWRQGEPERRARDAERLAAYVAEHLAEQRAWLARVEADREARRADRAEQHALVLSSSSR